MRPYFTDLWGKSFQHLQVWVEVENGDRDGESPGGGIDRGAIARRDFYVVRDGLPRRSDGAKAGEQQCGDSCGAQGQSRQAAHRHVGSGTFVGAELLHGAGRKPRIMRITRIGRKKARRSTRSAGVLACEFTGRPAPCSFERRDAARTRSRDGCATRLPGDVSAGGPHGVLKLADLENAITDETAVVSLMWANNETGVLFPVTEIAEICRARGVLFHCDAVQAAGLFNQ